VIFRYINYAKPATYQLQLSFKSSDGKVKRYNLSSLKKLDMVISRGSRKSSRNMLGIGGF